MIRFFFKLFQWVHHTTLNKGEFMSYSDYSMGYSEPTAADKADWDYDHVSDYFNSHNWEDSEVLSDKAQDFYDKSIQREYNYTTELCRLERELKNLQAAITTEKTTQDFLRKHIIE